MSATAVGLAGPAVLLQEHIATENRGVNHKMSSATKQGRRPSQELVRGEPDDTLVAPSEIALLEQAGANDECSTGLNSDSSKSEQVETRGALASPDFANVEVAQTDVLSTEVADFRNLEKSAVKVRKYSKSPRTDLALNDSVDTEEAEVDCSVDHNRLEPPCLLKPRMTHGSALDVASENVRHINTRSQGPYEPSNLQNSFTTFSGLPMSAGGNGDGHDGNGGNRPHGKGPARYGNEHGDADPDANNSNNHTNSGRNRFSREDEEVIRRVAAEHSELPGILRDSFTTFSLLDERASQWLLANARKDEFFDRYFCCRCVSNGLARGRIPRNGTRRRKYFGLHPDPKDLQKRLRKHLRDHHGDLFGHHCRGQPFTDPASNVVVRGISSTENNSSVQTPSPTTLQLQDMHTDGNNADGDHLAPSEAPLPLDQIDDRARNDSVGTQVAEATVALSFSNSDDVWTASEQSGEKQWFYVNNPDKIATLTCRNIPPGIRIVADLVRNLYFFANGGSGI
ncbi:hypothetical protein HK405_003425 [Cladochytrium tenue]|nr:hypothetical protein HK405_003425 [Cladochytrium tenue]